MGWPPNSAGSQPPFTVTPIPDQPQAQLNASQFAGVIQAIQGLVVGQQQLIAAINAKFPNWVAVPATAASAGIAGQVAYDASHLYVCIAPSTWVRCALATF